MLADTINSFIENRLSSVYTAIPGVVKKITGNIADIQPAVSKNGVSLPVLPDVPIVFPASSKGGFVFEVAKGDSVLLIFCSSSIDEWLAGNGKESDTDDPRRFDITDAVAIPGLFSLGSVPKLGTTDGCIMSHEDTTITIKKSGDVVIGGDSAKKLINEEFQDMFNDHTHDYIDTIFAGTGISTPTASLSGSPHSDATGIIPIAITDSEMTSKTSAV